MTRTRFGLIGSGWRADFYLRAAAALPDQLEPTGVLTRNPGRIESIAREFRVAAPGSLDELLATEPAFVGGLMTRSHVEVPGGRLLVIDEGSGPPIVLLHAGIADLRSWDAMVPFLTSAGYRTVRFDQRAVGGSTTEQVAFSRVADLLAVLEATGIGKAALVGNSLGGMLAFDTAIVAPDRVVAVVGVGAGLGGFHVEPTDGIRALDAEEARLEAADPRDPAALADFDVRVWVDGPGQPPTRVPAAIRELVYEMDLLDPERHQGDAQPIEPPANDRLSELRCPILAIAGELDLPDVVQTARHLEANAPNARALIWPDVAHMIGMEQPERLVTAIVEFLAPLERWS